MSSDSLDRKSDNMKRKHAIPLVLVLFLSLPAQGIHAQSGLDRKLDEYISPYVDREDFSGVVLIAKEGKVLYKKSFGLYDVAKRKRHRTNGRFAIASVSKPFTAVAILMLVEQGKLKLTDRIDQFIEGIPNGEIITIHHLLSHTSGLRANFANFRQLSQQFHSTEELMELIRGTQARRNPGERFSYSGNGYRILARIIEKASGKTYGQFLEEEIFSPLKMKETGNIVNEKHLDAFAPGYRHVDWDGLKASPLVDFSNHVGGGSLYSTASDLYKFDRAIKGHKLLNPVSTDSMLSVKAGSYGYGWYCRKAFGRDYVEHNGYLQGYRAYLTRYLEDDVTIIMLSNVGANNALDNMKNDLAAIVFGEDYEKPKAMAFKALSADEKQSLMGTYEFDFRPGFRLIIRQNVLGYLEMSVGGPFSVVHALNTKELFHKGSQTGYQFRATQTEVLDEVVMRYYGQDFIGKRVEE